VTTSVTLASFPGEPEGITSKTHTQAGCQPHTPTSFSSPEAPLSLALSRITVRCEPARLPAPSLPHSTEESSLKRTKRRHQTPKRMGE
uniref:Uncharacterized protein n=1 Tax=Hippocampus comes TaxID=109280 RepID=A0A3Q3DNB9_HIPCM